MNELRSERRRRLCGDRCAGAQLRAHSVTSADVLRDGDLILIDDGCELDGYAPISPHFSLQRSLCATSASSMISSCAQQAAIDEIKPGAADGTARTRR